MKPNELMLGDWVKCGNSYTRVKALNRMCSPISVDGIENLFKSVEPIPLTPSMLVDNGFKMLSDEVFEYFVNPTDDTWSIRVTKDSKCEGNILWNVSTFGSVYNALFEYVHEFQQWLRLDGLLMADTFKLK